MQAILQDDSKVEALIRTLSKPRMNRYLREANSQSRMALSLYHWNSLLSQSLYMPLQMWEVGLRNRLNEFLCWKYNQKWFDDPRAVRTLTRQDRDRLNKTISRQKENRGGSLTSDQIVSDLSAGFWVSLLGRSYEIPFAWRYNIKTRIFSNSANLSAEETSLKCGKLLDLRNRIAHHEPIFHLDLEGLRADLDIMLNGMCGISLEYVTAACTFNAVWGDRPITTENINAAID